MNLALSWLDTWLNCIIDVRFESRFFKQKCRPRLCGISSVFFRQLKLHLLRTFMLPRACMGIVPPGKYKRWHLPDVPTVQTLQKYWGWYLNKQGLNTIPAQMPNFIKSQVKSVTSFWLRCLFFLKYEGDAVSFPRELVQRFPCCSRPMEELCREKKPSEFAEFAFDNCFQICQ